MLSEKYNYTLNGVEHEIILNHSLKIDQPPINDKILISNKYMLKYINDLLDYNSIEYCLLNNTLLGVYIFNGINIFNSLLEICISDIYLHKIKKLENQIKNNDFDIKFYEKYIKISTIFIDDIKIHIYIYLLENDSNNDTLKYYNYKNNLLTHKFYDIYPIKKNKFEEFELSIPNKIENILETYNFNLNYIVFSKNKNDENKNIIEEIQKNDIQTLFKNNLYKFISTIKPLFFQDNDIDRKTIC
jgi:hypothetical protein